MTDIKQETLAVTLFITDKTGKRFWETHCGLGFSSGEEHNLKAHLERIKTRHRAYAAIAIDPDSARLVIEAPPAPSIDEIAAWLTEEATS